MSHEFHIKRFRHSVEGAVRCDVIRNEEAERCRELSAFCCGLCAREPSAAEVNGIVGNLFHGEAVPQHVVLLRDQRDLLLGIASVRPEGALRFDPVPYLNAYGREKQFKGWTLADGETSIGAALVRAAVELVTPIGGLAPEIQALVLADNYRSQRPLEALGFERAQNERLAVQIRDVPVGIDVSQIELPTLFQITCPSGKVVAQPQPQELWFRPGGLDLVSLDPEVYAGPAPAARESAMTTMSAQ